MARQPRTPGATTEAPKTTEVITPTTAQRSDDVLNEILGTPDIKDAETTASTEPTSTASEPVTPEPTAEELQAKKEYEEFLAWRNNKAAVPVAQHAPTSGVVSEPAAKRTRQVCGPQGWTTEEY
ncbi:hypothetical protein [Acinetobacter terrae]|uniref:Uncharacterized protein n=1 Tax=Acinetobacter terrae TaxID=2731247 RepID=A0A4R0EQT1_9GAMM|nr:hypothetical protein [Acinetobacter terrae]TCB62224.1 hypothetical protein E0H85_01500 [Acinetobacter terrae]